MNTTQWFFRSKKVGGRNIHLDEVPFTVQKIGAFTVSLESNTSTRRSLWVSSCTCKGPGRPGVMHT